MCARNVFQSLINFIFNFFFNLVEFTQFVLIQKKNFHFMKFVVTRITVGLISKYKVTSICSTDTSKIKFIIKIFILNILYQCCLYFSASNQRRVQIFLKRVALFYLFNDRVFYIVDLKNTFQRITKLSKFLGTYNF